MKQNVYYFEINASLDTKLKEFIENLSDEEVVSASPAGGKYILITRETTSKSKNKNLLLEEAKKAGKT